MNCHHKDLASKLKPLKQLYISIKTKSIFTMKIYISNYGHAKGLNVTFCLPVVNNYFNLDKEMLYKNDQHKNMYTHSSKSVKVMLDTYLEIPFHVSLYHLIMITNVTKDVN